ncbi:MAG: peptidylprolyl isomerase [Saccharospirillum sp.]|nr:peptidylprolyl isomerase [Saccharospirillum sp.]
MKVEKNTVVLFHYRLTDDSGVEIESNIETEPTAYLHGHGGIIAGLEKAMAGRESGESFQVTVPPEDAYGPRKPDAMQRLPIKHLLGAKRWKPGMIAQVQTSQGRRHVMVAKVGHKFADVDTNHPLAGRALTFDITISEVRVASAEEIAHGHAHGVGGHHH